MGTPYPPIPAAPVSALSKDSDRILSLLERTPIIISNHGRRVGVLVNFDDWVKLANDAEELERLRT